MTCVIGYLDKLTDSVWLGCDSLGSNGFSKYVYDNSKIFKNKTLPTVAIGGTGTFRHLDLLETSKELFNELERYKEPTFDREYMISNFIPKVYKLFSDGIYSENKTSNGAPFIIGISNKLYMVQCDFSVLEPSIGFCAVGSGEFVASGSLFATKDIDMPIPDKIRIALEAAEAFSCGVQRPFRIINTKTDDTIVF